MLGTVKYVFPVIISLFHWSIFFFHDGSLLGNADETMQTKMVFELAVSSGVPVNQASLPWFIRSKDLGIVPLVLYF